MIFDVVGRTGRWAVMMMVALMLTAAEAEAFQETRLDSAYGFSFTAPSGEAMPLEAYHGRLLLIVNIAQHSGYGGQYAQIHDLLRRYEERGLVVIGVMSDDFPEEGPSAAPPSPDSKELREGKDVSFPVTADTHVIGRTAHPFYRWVLQRYGVWHAPRWNFHKYLISPEGAFINHYHPTMEPISEKLIHDIEANLPL